MDSVVLQRVEMAVRSITGSSVHGPNSVFQNLDQIDFSGNPEDTPIMTASSRTDLNINHSRNDEMQKNETTENNDLPALRSNYEGQTHTHQSLHSRLQTELLSCTTGKQI